MHTSSMAINFDNVFDFSPLGMMLLDSQSSKILRANPSACALLGYGANELETMNWQTLFSSPAQASCNWSDGIVRECPLRKADQSQLLCDMAFSILPPQEGSAGMVQVILMPCQQRQKTQQEQEAMLAAQEQRQKLEALGRLAGGMAHDFNNLLAVISGNLEMLLPEVSSKDVVGECTDALERAQSLARQILQYSKKTRPALECIDLCQSLEAACNIVRRAWRKGGVPNFMADRENALVNISAPEFESTVMNLLSNAFDASDPDELRVTVSVMGLRLTQTTDYLRGTLEPGDYVCVGVQDQGRGIDPKIVPQLFDPYFTTKDQKGTGIGLAQVAALMQQAGGAINLESDLNAGTCWTLIFPLAKSEESPKAAAGSQGAAPHPLIAVVDDEPSIVRLVGRVLKREGFESRGFDKPQEALNFLEKRDDAFVLITDARMPGLTGPGLAKALKGARKHFSSLLLSGYSDEMDASDNPFDEHLLKPVRVKELVDVVRRLCQSVR